LFQEYLQFINGGDGILVFDRDADGVVDAADLFGGRDLVGRDVDNAFEDLALLDFDGNGVINSSDTNWTELKVWRRNSTGLELVLLNDVNVNVTEIRLAYRDLGASDPPFTQVIGTFNSSSFDTEVIAAGVNLTTNFFGVLAVGDFLVLDLDNSANITITSSCTQCTTPITINLESPVNASTESSDSTPGFTFNITDNSATVNCTLWINSSGTLASFANNNSVLNATSTTVTANTSLSNGEHYWWIDCSDDSGAPVTVFESIKRLLTLSILAITSSISPDSGEGNGNVLFFRSNTFIEDDVEFSEKGTISRSFPVKRKIRIKIDDEQHFVEVISLTNSNVIVSVSSTPQQAELSIGEEKKFNVNDDNYYDLIVKLTSIVNNRANLDLKYLHEKISEEDTSLQPSTEETEEVTEEIAGRYKLSNRIFVIIILIIGAAILYRYNVKGKR